MSILISPILSGGASISFPSLYTREAIVAAYPFHVWPQADSIRERVLAKDCMPWQVPLDDIRDYFGEKIGLYFGWMCTYSTWLAFPALIGLITFINIAADGYNPDAETVPYFGVLVAIWGTCFTEYWKRRESKLSMLWGMDGVEEREEIRPQYRGTWIWSFIDGQPMKWADPKRNFRMRLLSKATNLLAILVVLGAVTGMFFLSHFLTTGSRESSLKIGGTEIGATLAALVNATQIQIMNLVYGTLAKYMTKWENHRTDTEFEDALIAKTFVFQFVNSYSSLVYIAFIKAHVGDSCEGSCMDELSTQLGTLFIVNLLTGNFIELGLPYLKGVYGRWSRSRQRDELDAKQHNASLNDPLLSRTDTGSSVREVSEAEDQFSLEPYDDMLGTFGEYTEMVIQFGYCTMFVTAFPLAPLLALINNYVEIRVDMFKITSLVRRPTPVGAQDIGTWATIIEIMSDVCVVSNMGLICFTGSAMTGWPQDKKVWWFTLGCAMLLAFKLYLKRMVDDVPQHVQIQLARQKFLVSKLIEHVPDDDEGDEPGVALEVGGPNVAVHDGTDGRWATLSVEQQTNTLFVHDAEGGGILAVDRV